MSYETHDLHPLYTNQKSFYGKAIVTREKDCYGGIVYTLLSYGTPLLEVTLYNGNYYVCRLWNSWSATTGRHVNEFAQQIMRHPLHKKEWCGMWCGYPYKMTDGGKIINI